MNNKVKSFLIWFFSVVFTIAIAVYQKTTGPTYPQKGKITVADKEIKYKLIRSHSSSKNATIKINNIDTAFGGTVFYKRYKTNDDWAQVEMKNINNELIAELPAQPPAGKLIYRVFLKHSGENYALNAEPVVIRFKGDVPAYILIPHIIFMFLAMLLSTRTGLEVIFKRNNSFKLSIYTTISLFIGGIILGPIVQKFAFGAYWTGWPTGHDLTDNKTAIAFLFWLTAFLIQLKNRKNKFMILIASVVLLLVYLIPHSMWGSELNYESGKIDTGNTTSYVVKPVNQIENCETGLF
jgi:hypothetical protein